LLLPIVAGDRNLIVGRAFCGRSVLNDHDLAQVGRYRKRAAIAENRKRRVVFRSADVDVQIAGTRVADREARGCSRIRSRMEVQGTRRHHDLASWSRCRRWSWPFESPVAVAVGVAVRVVVAGGGNGWALQFEFAVAVPVEVAVEVAVCSRRFESQFASRLRSASQLKLQSEWRWPVTVLVGVAVAE